MGSSSKNGGNEAAKARADEQARQERIRAKHDIKLPRSVMEPGDPRWAK